MSNWTYTYTDTVTTNLTTINTLIQRLLLSPTPPQFDLKLNWQALILQTHASLNLTDQEIGYNLTEKYLVSPATDKHTSARHTLVCNFQDTLHSIKYHATAKPEALTTKHLKHLYQLLTHGLTKSIQLRQTKKPIDTPIVSAYTPNNLRELDHQLQLLLKDINNPGREHPVITTAKAHIRMLHLAPFNHYNHIYALVFAHLVLNRYSFSFRVHARVEPQLLKYYKNYLKAIESTKSGQLTRWFDFYTNLYVKALEHHAQEVSQQTSTLSNQLLEQSDLNDRQIQILTVFDNPETIISNKKIASRFGISQITASRDLAKLRAIGLVTQVGRGRSTTYRRM